ncbi:DUF192 domain-containing protein [Paraburkholderia humisilvae]|uniref:DUF192 domain-containing protein n=1 Tax=Paraburkholderia humisilvae TaxID=627669 RepID=A0A6J5DQG3_9BURK|nr:DUF192 domain-containing protein [Paraburkholderia humisilvae]CAB3755175.1 hypothetical protein LMG29542_02522 [Paraburkholderia humisilvae]
MKSASLMIDGRACGIRVKIAASAPERMRGLLGRGQLADDEALLLVPCRSVHTFGMRFPIDVMFVDRLWRVVAIHRRVPPARMLFSLRAARTLEMSAGMTDVLSITIGDQLGLETHA